MASDQEWAELGHGVRAVPVEHSGVIVGVIHEHPAADGGEGALGGGRCHGYMPLTGHSEGDTWDVAAGDLRTSGFDGLTLTPSSLCKLCGHHGFITDGAWVPA